ncbi:MAG: adenine phosphoribosyltransferase [Alphaproteobacteria bacterium]|jgi:adenine phosphoribosyltransferase|tara:strand:- start:1627 stop:2148 length:522 start_codon:yes stop_codon:yes gene_type:complete
MNDKIINSIRIIKDFPKKGIDFYDIASLLANPDIFSKVIDEMTLKVKKMNATAIAGIDSRGFIFASVIAYKLKLKLIIIRKQGKLPGKTFKSSYNLEYGSNTLEIQKDFINSKDKVVVIDDILATGGTINAAFKLIKKTNANLVGALVLLELVFLNGRAKLKSKVQSISDVSS